MYLNFLKASCYTDQKGSLIGGPLRSPHGYSDFGVGKKNAPHQPWSVPVPILPHEAGAAEKQKIGWENRVFCWFGDPATFPWVVANLPRTVSY